MAFDLRHLRALLAVVDEGTFTDAAIALGTTQASVSRSVASLESDLGVRLLRRTSRGAALTSEGIRTVQHARRIMEEAAAIRRQVLNVDGEIRVGYAWSALGEHTTALQRQWSAQNPGSILMFVHANTATAGLIEGAANIAITRRPLNDRRFDTALVGTEQRYAAVASDHRLARRRSIDLSDFAGETVGIESCTGTTSEDLWLSEIAPAHTRLVHGADEWLTLIAAGQAIGITSAATVAQHPRPGVTYRPVRDAEPVRVQLAWWRDTKPAHADAITELARDLYSRAGQSADQASIERDPPLYVPK